MKPLGLVLALTLAISVTACARKAPQAGDAASPFIVMDESLAPLKRDFNDAAGKVRLLFLSGPTCGICLRGLADMNSALLAGTDDPRLRTFVVSVPALGATEQDARASMPLIDNPGASFYWEPSGVIGLLYQDRMKMSSYAWDMWFIYGPDARWNGKLPPKPDFWMHQLPSLPSDKYLDADEFAARARSMLADLPPARDAAPTTTRGGQDMVTLRRVAQPVAVALRQHIEGRGGFRNLEAIQTLRMHGTISFDSRSEPIEVTAHADGRLERRIGTGGDESVAGRTGDGLEQPRPGASRGLAWPLERRLLSAYEIDGPLVNWKQKGHSLDDHVGMARIDGAMAWQLDLVQREGPHWHVFIDSHTGMELRRVLLDDNGGEAAEIRYSDYRIANADAPYPSRFDVAHNRPNVGFFDQRGVVFPYRIDYLGPGGETIATVVFGDIDVEFAKES